MRIMIAVDGSEAASRANRHAIALAKALKDIPEIHLLYADIPLLPDARRALGAQKVAKYHEENARYATRNVRSQLNRSHIPFKEHFGPGDPASSILRLLKKQKFDVVIMGSHGRSAIKSALLGSVTSKVLANCRTPVTIVR